MVTAKIVNLMKYSRTVELTVYAKNVRSMRRYRLMDRVLNVRNMKEQYQAHWNVKNLHVGREKSSKLMDYVSFVPSTKLPLLQKLNVKSPNA